VRAGEVHAGAEGNRRELAPRVRPEEAVDRFVERAVAAYGDDQLGSLSRRLRGELDQVRRPLGENRLARESEAGGASLELGPAPARGAVVRRRIDEEDGLNGRRR
jgi:hypothetical protein